MRHRMLIVVLLFLNVAVAWSGDSAPLDPAGREAVLRKIETAQQGITTIQIRFTEERRFKALSAPLVYKGWISFDRASRILFMRYQSPVKHILRMENASVLLWVEGSPVADVMDMGQAQGVAARPDVFNISMKDFKGSIREEADSYLLEDSDKGQGNKSVTVLIDKSTLLARQVTITDPAGDETRLTFEDVTVNRPLPGEVASFKLPPGTRLNKVEKP